MARKKSKKSRKPQADAAAPAGDGGKEQVGDKTPPTPKKKRARKKAEKKRAARQKTTQAPPPVAEEPSAAEVAVLDEVAAGEQAAVPDGEPEAVTVPVEDIDAVLDDDEGDDLAALIAQTVAGAEPEDHPTEEPVEALDEGLVAPEPEPVAPPPAQDEPDRTPEPAPIDEPVTEPVAAGAGEPEEEIDLTGAIDLGPEITPELRDRLLAQTLAHAEIQDARYRVPYAALRPAGRWKALVAVVLVLLAGILAAAPPSWVRPDPPAQLDAAARVRALRVALLLQSQQVEAYRVRYQRLPESLDELAQRLPGLRYVRSGNRAYQIIAYEEDGNAVIFDSSNPSPEFNRLQGSFEPGVAP